MCALIYVHTNVDVCVLVLSECVCLWVGLYPGFAQSRRASAEFLIERDLRDMAEVSLLRHAETGLWWAVKTSRRLRTTNVCVVLVYMYVYACVGVLVFVFVCCL